LTAEDRRVARSWAWGVLIVYSACALTIFGLASLIQHSAVASKEPAATAVTATTDRNQLTRKSRAAEAPGPRASRPNALLFSSVLAAAKDSPMSWIDFVGYLAALTVLATFCMDTIVPLRGLAIASNVLFILYGIAGQLYPVLLLHAVLLPVTS
jgi:hypothetical protein